ncbi:MAG: hypothetical protein F8N39_18065 [Clostridiaceae bacterium]|nr:hypothetical protein [Clostridiaceae bacterium]
MNKTEFLERTSVRSFIEWISSRLDVPKGFEHRYIMKRPKGQVWECDSIYSAFENYNWSFTCLHAGIGKSVKGKTFDESKKLLSELSVGLNKSIEGSNAELCQRYCFSILDWGGVLPKNREKILSIGNDIVEYFKSARIKLNPSTFNTNDNYEDIIMNAGFTKIYSLFIEDFIIYDGRVGAALGLLVRKYCEDLGLSAIPPELCFAYGNARESRPNERVQNRRNPSNEKYKFPVLGNIHVKHTNNNLRANWLLKEILTQCNSRFTMLEKNTQLRALESALFMIGYDVLSEA